jgi:hypothetical protein
MLNIPTEYDRDTLSEERKILAKFLHILPLGGICRRALVDELGLIGTQMGTHNRTNYGRTAWDVLRYHPATVTSKRGTKVWLTDNPNPLGVLVSYKIFTQL